MRERGQRAAGHQQLLADLDDLDQLGGIAVEIDHVAGLARRHGAGVHRHADIGLRQRRRVVGAVAAHRHQLALRLLVADQLQLRLRRGLREEVVHAGFGGDRSGGQRVVAGDHHGADAHPAQLVEALADAALDDVLQVDDAEQLAVFGHRQRRAAGLGDLLGLRAAARAPRRRRPWAAATVATPPLAGMVAGAAAHPGQHRVDRALADRGRPRSRCRTAASAPRTE